MANPVGSMVGFFLPLILIDSEVAKGEIDYELGKTQIFRFLLIEGIPSLVVSFLVLIFWRSGHSKESILIMQAKSVQRRAKEKKTDGSELTPVTNTLDDNFESRTRELAERKVKISIWAQLKIILSNKLVVTMILCQGVGFGFIMAQSSVFAESLVVLGFKEVKKNLYKKLSPVISIACVFCGIIGSVVYSMTFLRKERQIRFMAWIFVFT